MIGSMCGLIPRQKFRLKSKEKRPLKGCRGRRLVQVARPQRRLEPAGQPDIVEGDVVTVTADGYTAAVNPIGSIVGTVDPTPTWLKGL